MQNDTPLIPASTNLPEITFKVIGTAILLTILLAVANTYLALKVGILTSASIPAAILSMGIFRFFKTSNILENNLVQTSASAGEAVAGGIVYTLPALIIIHYWNNFNYLDTFFIALCGGILGVMFSIPLRRILMNAEHLRFPEGRAIAEVLQTGMKKALDLKQLIHGGAVGALLELAQSGLKIIGSGFQAWYAKGSTIIGFAGGFTPALVGVGYLIGMNVASSIFIGALVGWGLGIPILSTLMGNTHGADSSAISLYSGDVRYMGIGAMIIAGFWTLLGMIRPFYESLQLSLQIFMNKPNAVPQVIRTEKDINIKFVLVGIGLIMLVSYFLFRNLFDFTALNLANSLHLPFIVCTLLYVLIFGFIFSAICGYFSGLVGVAASPGSAIVIASMILAALGIRLLLSFNLTALSQTQLLHAAAITIIIGGMITSSAAVTDNIQTLKVGHILGATPWKQQLMLMLGVTVAALIIPAVMELLFKVYGIGGVLPHPGMDVTQTLAAPPAAMMGGLAQGIFNHQLPWSMMISGALIMSVFIAFNYYLQQRGKGLSILGVAIGIYLPLASSTPLFIGGLISLIMHRILKNKQKAAGEQSKPLFENKLQKGLVLACGLVAGAAIMDVLLAIPMLFAHNPDVLAIMPASWSGLATILGFVSVLGIGYWIYRVVAYSK